MYVCMEVMVTVKMSAGSRASAEAGACALQTASTWREWYVCMYVWMYVCMYGSDGYREDERGQQVVGGGGRVRAADGQHVA
jgi:hypothetical protein